MKKTVIFITSAIFAITVLPSFSPLAKDNPIWNDGERRIAEFIREHGHYREPPWYPEGHEYWDKIRWYHGQGEKFRPVLIFLLENEYKTDSERKFNLLAGLKNSPGDKSDVVDYIRENLPLSFNRKEKHEANGCMAISLEILGLYGNPDDIHIIRMFKDDGNAIVQKTAKAALERMEQRIGSGDFSKKEPRDQRPDLEVDLGAKHQKPGTPAGSNGPGNSSPSEFRWILIGSLLILMISVGVWLKARVSRR